MPDILSREGDEYSNKQSVSVCNYSDVYSSSPHVCLPRKGHTLLVCSIATVCNRSRHLVGSPKLVWHPACLIKEGGYVDLSMDTLHLKIPWFSLDLNALLLLSLFFFFHLDQ